MEIRAFHFRTSMIHDFSYIALYLKIVIGLPDAIIFLYRVSQNHCNTFANIPFQVIFPSLKMFIFSIMDLGSRWLSDVTRQFTVMMSHNLSFGFES